MPSRRDGDVRDSHTFHYSDVFDCVTTQAERILNVRRMIWALGFGDGSYTG